MHSTLALRHNVVPYPRFGGELKKGSSPSKNALRVNSRAALWLRAVIALSFTVKSRNTVITMVLEHVINFHFPCEPQAPQSRRTAEGYAKYPMYQDQLALARKIICIQT